MPAWNPRETAAFALPIQPWGDRLDRADNRGRVWLVTDEHAADVQFRQKQITAAIERLGSLRDKGLITEEEFQAKKTQLLARF
ncbi:MAG TPA: SHOCT domain-containing protein [Planctomycetota bacterium]|nr:SHOCT domain-containing protein [Planctomycetota bacterium]